MKTKGREALCRCEERTSTTTSQTSRVTIETTSSRMWLMAKMHQRRHSQPESGRRRHALRHVFGHPGHDRPAASRRSDAQCAAWFTCYSSPPMSKSIEEQIARLSSRIDKQDEILKSLRKENKILREDNLKLRTLNKSRLKYEFEVCSSLLFSMH